MVADDELDTALIRSEIVQLAYRYAVAVDSRDIKALSELFMPEPGGLPVVDHQQQVFEKLANGSDSSESPL
jgi:hypothetical protein